MHADDRTPRDGDSLAITTMLVERPKMLRRMLCEQLQASAIGLAQVVADEEYYVKRGQGLRKTPERAVRRRLAEMNECMMLLGQIGWR